MIRRLVLLGVVVFGCTSPNPKSCADGLCTDQALPFCDVDGTLSGVPATCIAVTCAPAAVGGCRGSSALVCNTSGNDYDLLACTHGCDAEGCNECSASDQCPTGRPVCDIGGSCRTCATDDECPSSVCERGVCVPESGILYAASGGSDNSTCSRSVPCTPRHAVALAITATVPLIVRMLPGIYAQGLSFDRASAAPINIVASGATVVAANGLTVNNGASAKIRGLSITGSSFSVTCGATSEPASRLALESVRITAGSGNANLLTVANCTVTADVADIDLNASTGNSIAVTTDGDFTGNRLRVHGQMPSRVAGVGSRIAIRVTNSLLVNTEMFLSALDSGGAGSSLIFGYNTIVLSSGSQLDCAAGNFRTVIYDDNIVVGDNTLDVASGAGCILRNNVLFPQVMVYQSNVNAEPMFVGSAAGDYHLKASSPAVDAAAGTVVFPAVQPDYDGTPRPQGAKPDIGAFERKP